MIGAVDIGGTKIAAGIVDEQGNTLAKRVSPTDPRRGWEEALGRTITMLRQSLGDTGGELRGIGIGSTGPVDPVSGTIGTADLLPGWLGAPFGARLSDEFGVPVAMENDADSAALAESIWGLGRDAECFLYVTIGTGIGVGIVHQGRLFRGAGGGHPELGHLLLDITGGPRCYCGLNGCWEVLASGPAMETWYAAQPEAGGARLSAKEICARASTGDRTAVRALEREAWYIGLGLVNLATCFCPDVIALGGGVMQGAPSFVEQASEMVRTMVTQVPAERIRVGAAALGADAGLKGAACAWLHRYGNNRT